MRPRLSTSDTGAHLREAAEDARWGVREAVWRIEEGVVWRASDATRAAVLRALRATEPLQRLVQTRLVWPLGDRLDEYGNGMRTGLATTGVIVALAAGAAGAVVAGDRDGAATPSGAGPVLALQPAADADTLQGVTPNFVADPNRSDASGERSQVKPAPPPAGDDSKSADAVAWRFAEAFVQYEIGEVDDKVSRTFKASATRPLAVALSGEPPRLPAGKEVPRARVLNVVLGKREGKEMTASVSLLRLKAASELRLTLQEDDEGWRVAGVLG
jgi:hypothetical protein